MSTPITPIQPQTSDTDTSSLPSTTLSTKNLFTHYFLLHDFFLRMVKSPSNNAKFFDLQIEVNDSMKKAANVGGKVGQGGVFASLLLYCMKGRTIKLKLFYGFLYMYWIEHFYTLGAYTGILVRMPSLYKKVATHYLTQEPTTRTNPIIALSTQMSTNTDYQDTQEILNKIFKQSITQEKTYMVNEYFTKNKDKYYSKDEGTLVERPNMKLKYMDCFLTRYVYYTWTRWYTRKLTNWGLMKGEF